MKNTCRKEQTDKYYGLANKGATCYLNSVLQVLFMTKDFRDRITSDRHSPPPTGKKHIDSELRNFFRDLEIHSADTSDITGKLSIRDVAQQHDAAEYYEKILRLTRPEASEIFLGKLINRTKCCDCGKGPEIEAPFWSLPLPLVNNCNEYSVVRPALDNILDTLLPRETSYVSSLDSVTVENGIKNFFCSSKISGDNQMYCETCDDKRDADLGCEIEYYPQVLVLLLKRFQMIFGNNMWSKINCPVKIPRSLTFQDNQKYNLYAFVDHIGDLQSGHYSATVRSQDDDQWYIFDDLNVQKSPYHHFQLDFTELSTKVYLLFYQREKEEPGVRHGPKANTEQSRLKGNLNIDNNDTPIEAKKRKNNSICEHSNGSVSPNNREIRQDKTSKKSQPEGSHSNQTETKNSHGGDHKSKNKPVKRSHSSVPYTGPHITQSNQQFHQCSSRSSRERRGGSLHRSDYHFDFGADSVPGSPRGSDYKRYYSQDNQLEKFRNEIHGNRRTNEGWKKNGTREAERLESHKPKSEINPQQCLDRSEKQRGRGAGTYSIDRRGEAKTDRREKAKTNQQQAKGNERKKSPKNETEIFGLNKLSLDEYPNTFIPVRGEVLETNDEPSRKKCCLFSCFSSPKDRKGKRKQKHK